MTLLIPSALDLATWAGVVFAALAFLGFGRLLSAGRALPEAALVAGWGGAAALLTLWGALTTVSLRGPAIAIVLLGGLGLVLPRVRLTGGEWRSVGRLIILALPLLALLASARPSLPDTFLNLLPNAAYLYDHGIFPGDARAAAYSYLPGAPYNLQLAGFVAALVTPGFPASALIGFNLLLQLAAGLLLARLVCGSEETAHASPSWTASALGLLLAMALNPGFVPRYHLSSYSEPSVTVSLAFAGWLAARLIDRAAAKRSLGMTAWLLALTLAALVNIKQDSVALAAAVVISAAALALIGPGAERRRGLAALALSALPAVGLYFLWRWYVLAHFAVGELKPMPVAQWQFGALPLILWNMLGVIGEKIVYFGSLAALFAVLAWRLRHQGCDLAARAGLLLLGVFLIYDAALVFAYISDFPGTMGSDAHSYFRYMTHLSLLLMVAAVLLLRDRDWIRRWAETPRVLRFAPAGLVIVALAVPLPFLRFLRFDLEVPQLRSWRLAHEVARQVKDGQPLALVLPGDNGSVENQLGGLLRLTPPRRPDLKLTVVDRFGPQTLATLAGEGYRWALLSCVPAGVPDAPAGEAALFAKDADGWRVVASWPYAPVPRGARWSQVLSPGPLCLPR